MRRFFLLAALALCALPVAPAVADPCPGADPCPYASAQVLGDRDGGVLRFPQAVALGPGGDVYVGDEFTHSIEVFGSDGTFKRSIGVSGAGDGQLDSVGGLAVGADGQIYAADSSNRIVRFAPDGTPEPSFGGPGHAVGRFAFGNGRSNDAGAGGGVTIAGGNLYVADTGNNRIERLGLDGSNPFAFATGGALLYPQGIAALPGGVAIADDDHHRLALYTFGGRFVRSVGKGPGVGPGQLNFPYDVASDARGGLYTADDNNHRVVAFGPGASHPYLARWGGFGTAPDRLAYPRAIAADASGNTYVTDTGNDRISVFGPTGLPLRQFGTSGRANGQYTVPQGIGVDPSGLRAIADSADGRIVVINQDGSVAAVWGTPAPGPTVLRQPVGVAFGPDGNAYVLDRAKSRVVELSRDGLILRMFGEEGVGPGKLDAPVAIATDGASNVYVADAGNGRIEEYAGDGTFVQTLGSFTTLAGLAVAPDGSKIFGVDANTYRVTVLDQGGNELASYGGKGKKAGKLNAPAGIALDAAGDEWIADRGGNRIVELDPDGKFLAQFGARGTGDGELVHPLAIAIDCHGLVTVADTGNNRLEQFAVPNLPVTPCAAAAPVSTPPSPALPVAPLLPAPVLGAKLVHAQGVLARGQVQVVVQSDQRAKLGLSVTLAQRAARKHHKLVSITVSAPPRTLPAGAPRTISVGIGPLGARRLRAALHGARGIAIRVQVTATPTGGSPAIKTLAVLGTA